MAQAIRTKRKVKRLRELLTGRKTLLIVMQDYPDPDAVAAAGALRLIANQTAGVSCSLAHGGSVGRAENRALIRYLGLNLRPVGEVAADSFDLVAMVDTQPATGNNSLAPEARVDMVFDHHPVRKATRSAAFTDVRRAYGSTSTIFHEYLQVLGLKPDIPLATAMCYGIRSDTQDLGRDSTQADIDAYVALYPQANKRMLGRIQRAPEPVTYYRTLAQGLQGARVYERCLVAPVGQVESPEIVAEIAELLMRCENVDISLARGVCQDCLHLSLRTLAADVDLGKLMRSLVRGIGSGGGHEGAAGGQIPLAGVSAADRRKIEQTLLRRLLRRLRIKERKGVSLLSGG